MASVTPHEDEDIDLAIQAFESQEASLRLEAIAKMRELEEQKRAIELQQEEKNEQLGQAVRTQSAAFQQRLQHALSTKQRERDRFRNLIQQNSVELEIVVKRKLELEAILTCLQREESQVAQACADTEAKLDRALKMAARFAGAELTTNLVVPPPPPPAAEGEPGDTAPPLASILEDAVEDRDADDGRDDKEDEENNKPSPKSNKKLKKSSQYRGVSFKKRDRKFQAEIVINGRRRSLGYFEHEIDAAKAYDAAVVKENLDLTKLNFSLDKSTPTNTMM